MEPTAYNNNNNVCLYISCAATLKYWSILINTDHGASDLRRESRQDYLACLTNVYILYNTIYTNNIDNFLTDEHRAAFSERRARQFTTRAG